MIALVAMALAIGCAPVPDGSGVQTPAKTSPTQAYQIAWFAYTTFRAGAESYCSVETNQNVSTCKQLELLKTVADAAINAANKGENVNGAVETLNKVNDKLSQTQVAPN